jgi:polar amino acid transport system substrate-binding protein
VLFAAVSAGVLAGGEARAQEAFTLSTGMAEPWTTDDHKGFTDRLIPALFKRIGIDAKLVVNRASARALSLANDGIDDGIAARIEGLEAKFPNLIRVPEPIFVNDFVAVGRGAGPARADWESIAGYRVSYIIGWQIFEGNLKPTHELLLAKDSEQLMALLKAGKIDLALHERWQALWQAREDGLRVQVVEPPLARVKMYIYLHRKHAGLIGRVSQELAAMKADGSYQAILKTAFQGLGPQARLEP